MPLIQGKSKKSLQKNIETEMDAGKPQKQALAIAYEVQRKNKRKMAEGGEVRADIDTAKTKEDEEMLHGAKTSHMPEADFKDERRPSIDERDEEEMDMMRYAHGGAVEKPKTIAEAIMKKRKMAEGGEVELDHNSDEHLNDEDDLSFEAARKHTYYDLDQVEEQPMDSNEHGDELKDADRHSFDMVSKIRRKMMARR